MMAAAQNPEESLNFYHSPHPPSLLQGLQELRADNLLTDVVLCVDGKHIPCHRSVLAARSGYFRGMFCSGHRESSTHKIDIYGVNASTLELLVDYLYTAEVTITNTNAVHLLEGASFFQIQPVFDACAKFMSEHLSVANCLKMVDMGCTLCPDVYQKAVSYAMKNFSAVSKTLEFLQLTKEQLNTFISSDVLNASEEAVYEAVMRWINHDAEVRKKEMRELMALVRFPLMDKLYFLDNVESSEDMRKSCHDIVTETFKYHMVPEKVQSPRTRPRVREAVVLIGGIDGGGSGCMVISNSITMTYAAAPSRSSWVPMTTMMEESDTGFAVAVLGTSDIIISAGYNSTRNVWLYQTDLGSWSKLAPMNLRRQFHQLAVVQDNVYAIGGRTTSATADRALTSVEVYDRSLNKWTEGVPLPEPTSEHAAAVVDGTIYVIGGRNTQNRDTSTVYQFTPGDTQWHPQMDMPVRDSGIAATVLNGNIYVAGLPSNILCYRPGENGGSWRFVVTGRIGRNCSMTVFDGKIYIYGGRYRECYGILSGNSEVWCLEPETRSLNHVGTMPKGLSRHGCVTILKS